MKNIINRDASGMLDGYQERYNINDTMKKDIDNKNNKGEWHGYNEWYFDNKLFYKSNFKNGWPIGYVERYNIKHTEYYIR